MRRIHVRWLVPVAALAGASLLSATAAGAEKPADPAPATESNAAAAVTSADAPAPTDAPVPSTMPSVIDPTATSVPAPASLSVASVLAVTPTTAPETTTTVPDPEGPEAPPYATPLADDPCDPDYLATCPGSEDSVDLAARAGAKVAENPPVYALAATVREGYTRHRVLRIPVLLDWATPNGVTVHWRTSPRWGSAKSGTDYIATSGDITFPPAGHPGATIQLVKIDIPPNGPTIHNQEFETLRIVLSKPVGAYFPGTHAGGRPRRTLSVTGVILDIRTKYGPPFN